jgi:hypothetical protein
LPLTLTTTKRLLVIALLTLTGLGVAAPARAAEATVLVYAPDPWFFAVDPAPAADVFDDSMAASWRDQLGQDVMDAAPLVACGIESVAGHFDGFSRALSSNRQLLEKTIRAQIAASSRAVRGAAKGARRAELKRQLRDSRYALAALGFATGLNALGDLARLVRAPTTGSLPVRAAMEALSLGLWIGSRLTQASSGCDIVRNRAQAFVSMALGTFLLRQFGGVLSLQYEYWKVGYDIAGIDSLAADTCREDISVRWWPPKDIAAWTRRANTASSRLANLNQDLAKLRKGS